MHRKLCYVSKCNKLVLLRRVINNRTDGCSTCIVIDKAERLCTFQGSLLFTLLRLQELCQRNICVVLVSRTEWTSFSDKAGCLRPLMVYLPNYNKVETLKILSMDCKSDVLHGKFLNHLWEVFNIVCRNISKLRYTSLMLFPRYIEPIVKGEIQPGESRKL